jgi:hypothetical protein
MGSLVLVIKLAHVETSTNDLCPCYCYMSTVDISQRNRKFEPTVLGTPKVFKVENTLSLFVSFVNQWQVVIEENNISKLSSKDDRYFLS